jgi:hypothetical protein
MSPEYSPFENSLHKEKVETLWGDLIKKLANTKNFLNATAALELKYKRIEKSTIRFSTQSGTYEIGEDIQHYLTTIVLKKIGQAAVDNQNETITTVVFNLSFAPEVDGYLPTNKLAQRGKLAQAEVKYGTNGIFERDPKEALRLAGKFIKGI